MFYQSTANIFVQQPKLHRALANRLHPYWTCTMLPSLSVPPWPCSWLPEWEQLNLRLQVKQLKRWISIYVGLWRWRSILTSYHNSLTLGQFLTSHDVIGRALGRAPLILQVPHQTSLPISLASALHLSQVPSGSSFQMPHVLSIYHVSYLQFSNIPFFLSPWRKDRVTDPK